MALTGTDRGQGASNASSSTTYAFSPASNLTSGAMAVLCVSADNSASGGSTNNIDSVADTKNNTWTKRISPLYDPGAANAGIQGAIFTTPQNGGALTTGDTITITFGAATTAKSYTLMEVTASVVGGVPGYKTGGVNTGSATTTPTVTTASVPNGQMVIGVLCNEYGTAQTVTEDSDTTNGSWSTQQTAEVGSTTSGNTISSQRKVVTATATQTYNPTLGTSSDVILGWITIGEDITAAGASPTALTTATFAPKLNLAVIPPTKAVATATFAPDVIATGGGVTVTPPSVALATSLFAPKLNLAVIPPTRAVATATFAPSISTPRLVTPPSVALTTSLFAPVIKHQINGASPTALTTATFAPKLNLAVIPPTRAVVTATFAPDVIVAGGGVTVTPPSVALATSLFAPKLNLAVIPPTRAVATATFAPTIQAPRLVTVPTIAVAMTRFAPNAVVATTITPPPVSLGTLSFAPTITITTHVLVRPGTATLTLVAFPPTVDPYRAPPEHPFRVLPAGRRRHITLPARFFDRYFLGGHRGPV